MKRQRRWLFNFAAGASLLLLLLIAIFALVPGHREYRTDGPRGPSTKSRLGAVLDKRHVTLIFARPTPASSNHLWRFVGSSNFAGFWYGFYVTNAGPTHELSIPHWFVLLSACILPAVWVKRRCFAADISHSGHCVHCGYDLRASPDRCPECGAESAGREGDGVMKRLRRWLFNLAAGMSLES